MRVLKTSGRVAAATAVTLLAALCAASSAAIAATSSFTTKGAWTFASAPNLHPPKLKTMFRASRGLAAGSFLIANFKNLTNPAAQVGQSGPLILNSNLQPVWFKPVANLYTMNLHEQTYKGKPALSWWQGRVSNTGVTESGSVVLVDQHYNTMRTISAPAKSGWVITPHEAIVQGDHLWVTANSTPESIPAHKLPAGVSSTQAIVDSAVQEYSLTTGKLVYSWSALAHIPLTQSHVPANTHVPWDAYHVNSIQLLPGGFVTSMRNTWSGYRVNSAKGKIAWTLSGSGAGGSFKLPSDGHFEWQHDVELHAGDLVTVFDDACCNVGATVGPPSGPSRGLMLRLNVAKHMSSYVLSDKLPDVNGRPIETAFMGNLQLLPDGNAVVGWGSQPYLSEFSSSGKRLLEAELPAPDVSYRALFSSDWVGLPPLHAMRHTAKRVNGKTIVHASWDGATQVVAWRVLGGPDAKHLATLATGRRSGFDTAITVKSSPKHLKVQALDSRGQVLGTSAVFSPGASSSNGSSGGGGGSGSGGYGYVPPGY